MTTPARNAQTAALEALIEAHAIELKLPTVRRRFKALAAEALREQQTPVAYLGALLQAEMGERAERREKRRLIDARFPQIKRLEDFRFSNNPKVPQATIAALAEGGWISDREQVIFVGDSGTGKTHLAIARAAAACHAGRPFASPRWPAWPTSSKRPTAAASSHVSSPATPASNCWSSTSSATSRCPKVPPSWSSKCSQNATSAADLDDPLLRVGGRHAPSRAGRRPAPLPGRGGAPPRRDPHSSAGRPVAAGGQ